MTSSYEKTTEQTLTNINIAGQRITTKLNISDRTECVAPRVSFFTLKDHKPTFPSKPTIRLISPSKSDLGKISKQILDKVYLKENFTHLVIWNDYGGQYYSIEIEIKSWRIQNKQEQSR